MEIKVILDTGEFVLERSAVLTDAELKQGDCKQFVVSRAIYYLRARLLLEAKLIKWFQGANEYGN